MKASILLLLLLACPVFAQNQAHFQWSLSKAKTIPFSHTLAREPRLTASEREQLFKKIYALVEPFAQDSIEELGKKEFSGLVWNTRIELVDLNGDGVPEILAQASDYHVSCGATGNCAFWVFQKTSTGFTLLLDTRDNEGVGGVEYYTIRDDSSNGYRDLVFAAHNSASEKTLDSYQFNGKQYERSECHIASWMQYTKDKIKTLKAPIITNCE